MIQLNNVTKVFKKNTVLDNISYTFEEGKIYGLYGENGSGKTMLLRAVAGLIIPTSGEVLIDGKVLRKDISFPENTGIVIEHMTLLPKFTALENLKMLGKINGRATEEDMKEALVRVGLDPESHKKIEKFSLGMNQRLNIAQAIFEKQDIILLDEPTNALDEDGSKRIHTILKEERERGALVIMATHHKEDLTEICDVKLRVSNGRIIEGE